MFAIQLHKCDCGCGLYHPVYKGYRPVTKKAHPVTAKMLHKDLDKVARKGESAIIDIFHKSVDLAKKSVNTEKILTSLHYKNAKPIFKEIDNAYVVFRNSLKDISAPILEIHTGCGKAEAKYMSELLRQAKRLPGKEEITFKPFSDRAKKYLEKRTFSEMKNIADPKKLHSVVSDLFTLKHPDQAVNQIKDSIGLNEPFAKAVANYRQSLLTQEFADDIIDKRCEKYADRLLDVRADNIARTESMSALNESRREFRDEMFADPEINIAADEIFKKWNAADSACWICAEMDAADPIPYDEEYQLPNGDTTFDPEGHIVNCRCTDYLVFPGGGLAGEAYA